MKDTRPHICYECGVLIDPGVEYYTEYILSYEVPKCAACAEKPSESPLSANEGHSEEEDNAIVRYFETNEVIQGPTELECVAIQRQLHIRQRCQRIQSDFLEVGRLLCEARDNADWSTLCMESFDAYLDELNLPGSRSWISRIMRIHEELEPRIGTEKLLEIGVSKAAHLLPAARDGILDDAIIENARIWSERDLREYLGHHIPERETDSWVDCPRCGERIYGVRYVSKGINAFG